MKYYFSLILIVVCSLLLAGDADTLQGLEMPMFASPIFGFYADNFLGSQAAGRGYTGTSVPGGLPNGLLNPATLEADSCRLYVEANFKPGLKAENHSFYAQYEYPTPFSFAGLSFGLGQKLSAAVYYSCPTAIELQDFTVPINQGGDAVIRRPKYYLNQASLSLAWQQLPKVHWGLSIHNQWHYIDDPLFVNSWDRIHDFKYSLRVQPGFSFGNEDYGVGISGTLPTKMNWDQRYENYSYYLPLELSLGGHYTIQNIRLILEGQYRNEKVNSDAFDDYLGVKLGAEHSWGGNTVRGGYFYNPAVYYGKIRLPENPFAEDEDYFWALTDPILKVSDSNQHYLSLGYSWDFGKGDVNLAMMHAYGGRQPRSQINLGLSVYTSIFTKPRLPH